MSEPAAPKLDTDIPIPEIEPPTPETPNPDPASRDQDSGLEAACVVKEDETPHGRRLADEARSVAAAHAALLVDVEACKRVSMSRRSLTYQTFTYVRPASVVTVFGSLKGTLLVFGFHVF